MDEGQQLEIPGASESCEPFASAELSGICSRLAAAQKRAKTAKRQVEYHLERRNFGFAGRAGERLATAESELRRLEARLAEVKAGIGL